MNRNIALMEFKEHFDSLLPDQESLLIQLCDHLFRSGFVFDDASENEIEAGGWVISDFFDQEADVLYELVPRDRFYNFCEYVKKFDWPAELIKKKISQRIRLAFDQLAKGSHHNFNIRYNILHGLRQHETHPLYDLLLYIETYYKMVIGVETLEQEAWEEGTDFSKTNYTIEDLIQMRNQIHARFEGRRLVKGFLKHIAKKRGVSIKSLEPAEEKKERKNHTIKFLRPSLQSSLAGKFTVADVLEKSENEKTLDVTEKPEINSVQLVNQNELFEISLESDLEPDETGVAEEVRIKGNNTLKNKEEEAFSADSSAKSKTLANAGNYCGYASNLEKPKPKKNLVHPSVSAAELLSDLDEEEEVDDNNRDFQQVDSQETDVVFGGKKITQASMEKFVRQYPDSTLRYLLRRNLDGKPLSAEIMAVHSNWEKRGLLRKRLKKYVLKLMEWTEVPDLTSIDLVQNIRDRLYEVSHKDDILSVFFLFSILMNS